MKHIITSYFINSNDKDGKPLKTKDGKFYKKVVIKVNQDENDPKEYDDQYLSHLAFGNDDPTLFWKVGDEVEILVEKNGDFFNFRVPSRLDRLEERVEALEKFLLK
ncbi:MAG: hypothetical protein KBH94_06170 [Caldisericia bacterium]|nr:hypothetical protein [Caldisericia bacterium]